MLQDNFFVQYIQWHFSDVPKALAGTWKNFLLFNLNYFSIGLLFKSLLSPWRRYRESYGRGLDLQRYFEAFMFNIISRAIGAVMRIFLIATGLILEVLIFFIGLFIFISWFVWPLLLALGLWLGSELILTKQLYIKIPTLLENILPQFTIQIAAGLGLIVLVIAVFIGLIKNFNSKLKNPKPKITISQALASPEQYDLLQLLSYNAANAVKKAVRQAKQLKIEPNSSSLFYILLQDNPKLNFIFARLLLNIEDIKKTLLKTRPGPERFDLQKIILQSLKIAEKKKHEKAAIGDLLIALAKHNSVFQDILIKANLQNQDIENLAIWQENLEQRIADRKRFWTKQNLSRMGSIGKQWTSGYTLTLDQYSQDLTNALKNTLPEIVGHKEELESMERVLSQQKINNVLLIGEPGTGRRSITDALAVKSILGQSSSQVNYKRIVQLDMPSLLARLADPEGVEQTLDKIFRETVEAGNIILVIDEFHNFIGGKERPGAVDISGILGSYLRLEEFQIIAITTFTGLHKNIEQNPGALALFQKIEVSEISENETLHLLQNTALILERIHKKMISYPALREIISLTGKYVQNLPFPKKALEVLDEAVVYVSRVAKDSIVLPKHISRIVTEKTKIPVGDVESKEKDILLNLEKLIHQRLINQEEAVKEISQSLRRARSGVSERKGPMGGFLFLGPTGVGKTEAAKSLAEIYFGSEERMIRMDMSEFQAVKDIGRLIGAPGEEGLLTTRVREKPFSLILLDEIEKAHPNILNLFLQVLDEGHLTDGEGRKVDFKNSIIIATSNAGFQLILKSIQEKTEWKNVKQKILDYIFAKAMFRPEFINRFDAVVIFQPLSQEHLLAVAGLMLKKLQKNLKQKHINFIITEQIKEKLVELGYNPAFGARQMKRTLQDKVENPLARALLSGQLKRGNRVEVNTKTFGLIIK